MSSDDNLSQEKHQNGYVQRIRHWAVLMKFQTIYSTVQAPKVCQRFTKHLMCINVENRFVK